jgi:predicted transposase YbfD/YdcC
METILSILRDIRDPRDFNARHDLSAILFLALAATLCGAKSCVDIADFAAAHAEDLGEIVDLPYGAPSHDCFSRVFRLLDPEEMAATLRRFAQAMREGLGLGPVQGVVAIDGKSLKRGYERGKSHMPPLMVNVWDGDMRLSIAASRAPGGGEVAQTLAMLKTLTLKGCVVTVDALHCHAAMAEAVQASGADYALRLKGNQSGLFAAVEAAFAQADAKEGMKSPPFYEREERGHDRQEWRCASVIARPPDAPAFPGLVAFGRVETERRFRGKIETAAHYFVLSTMLTPERLFDVARSHWSVENNLHWHLDVSLHEDMSRTRKDNAPENISIIRHMALDMLRAHPDKRSINRKMNMAVWSKPYFYSLFAHMQ